MILVIASVFTLGYRIRDKYTSERAKGIVYY